MKKNMTAFVALMAVFTLAICFIILGSISTDLMTALGINEGQFGTLIMGLFLTSCIVQLFIGPLVDKVAFIDSARLLHGLGIEFFATRGTAEFLAEFDLPSTTVHWPLEKALPNAEALLEERRVDLVINIPKNYQEAELTNDYYIRRKAVDFGIPLITNIQLANRLAEALSRKNLADLTIKPLQAYGQ